MSAIGTTIPAFVASEQRLAVLRERRAARAMVRSLFRGKWRRVLIDMGRTQHLFRQVIASTGEFESAAKQMLVGVNLVKKAMKTHADILTARPVLLSTDEGFEDQEAGIGEIRERVLFDAIYHEAALRCFVEGEAALRVDLSDDGVVVCLAKNDDTFPVGDPGKDGQPTVWERRWIIERENPSNPRKPLRFLRIERHRAPRGVGVVEQEAYETDSTDVLQSTEGLAAASLDRVLGPGHGLEPQRFTGLPHPLITQLVAYRMDGEPELAIDEADLGLIDAMVAGLTRLSRTMEQHSEPKMRVPEKMMKDGRIKGQYQLFIDPERLVEYIQAHFEFDAMSEFFNSVMQWLIVSLDMAASLLGYKPQGGAAPDSTDKLRLEATLTLANGRRVASLHGPALSRVFWMASTVEARLPLRGWPVGTVRAKVRADLPKDMLEEGREQRELLEAGLTSRRRAIAAVHGDDHVDEILGEIEEDQKAATQRQQAALFGSPFGDPPASPEGDPGDEPGDDPSDTPGTGSGVAA